MLPNSGATARGRVLGRPGWADIGWCWGGLPSWEEPGVAPAAEDVRFARMADGREVAYGVMSQGDGPVVLHTHAATFPFDFLDADPMYDRFLRTLGQVGQLVLFDKPGTGASDPFDRGSRTISISRLMPTSQCLMQSGRPRAWVVGSSTTRGFEAAQARAHITGRGPLGAALLNPREPASVASADRSRQLCRSHRGESALPW